MIIVVYSEQPSSPVSSQHPAARRIQIGGKWVDYLGDEPPSPAEVIAFLTPRRPRSIAAIHADIVALPIPVRVELWEDLMDRWPTYTGPNSAPFAVLQLLAAETNLDAASILAAKARALALYVQDHPRYQANRGIFGDE